DFDRLIDDLRAGRLADEVPPHGTLCRVRRQAPPLVPATNAPDEDPIPAGSPSGPSGSSAQPRKGGGLGLGA
ncbi:MAG: hypothetical protein LC733_04825, partial [Actinobacteria bacterium]|nr:hypothetical protein [Actinomycetota bacterium]